MVRTDSLSGGQSVYGHVITNFSRMAKLLHFLTHGTPLARFARESSAIRHAKHARLLTTARNYKNKMACVFGEMNRN